MSNDNKLTRTFIRKGKYLTWNQFVYDGILTEEEAGQKQTDAGYDPRGYGFYSYKVVDGKTYFECSNSCD